MSLHVCLGCSTLYAIGLKACPHCGAPTRDAVYRWEDDVVKTSSAGGSTLYLAEGQPVPADLPDGVVLVGPGSGEVTDEAPAVAEVAAKAVRGPAKTPARKAQKLAQDRP